ncbi:pseudaminic acid cytidylyltransferase [Sungkyunkwania multivorans]|uniref:Pseudaminic acid cytidylyltransferase n=1 Tax=Sungkyunkwania multivorans TaxID=1173618 RepID=A0ABW3D1Z6_9FLAO
MARLAMIPARGGSKRILRKNIKDFLGKPIIAYSIEAALASNLFDEVMVSTDDPEIVEISKSYGAVVPFFRSETNADDHATLSDVIEEVLDAYKKKGKEFDSCCCILPTAPFVSKEKLLVSYDKLATQKLDAVFPVIEFSYPIQRSLKIEGSNVSMVWEEYLNTRSQDLPSRYHDAGQFYWINNERFMKEKKLFMKNSGAIVISALEAQDIDTKEDWKLAELKYKMMHSDR